MKAKELFVVVLLFVSAFILLPATVVAKDKVLCFYYDAGPMFLTSCDRVARALTDNDTVVYIRPVHELFDVSPLEADVVYIVTHGAPTYMSLGYGHGRVSWDTVFKHVHARVLVLDTCYAGYGLYGIDPNDPPDIDYIVATAGVCVGHVSSFSIAVLCRFKPDECPLPNVAYCQPEHFDWGLCALVYTGQMFYYVDQLFVNRDAPACIGGPIVWSRDDMKIKALR